MEKSRINILILAILGLTIISHGIARADLLEGLAAYFTFDQGETDSIRDMSLTGNNGIVNGSPKWAAGPGGKFGKALELDGVNDYIEVPDDGSLDIGDGDITMMLWIKHGDSPTDHPRPMPKMPLFGTDEPGFDIITVGTVSTEMQIFYGMSGATRQETKGGQDIADGEWHHLVALKEDNECKIYIDGELKASTVVTPMDISNDYPLIIGSNGQPSAHTMFSGTVDEVAFYTRALMQDEIKEAMEMGLPVAVESAGKLGITWGQIKGIIPFP